LIVQESKQKNALLTSVAGIPHLNLQIWDADSPVGAYASGPPMAVLTPAPRFRVEAAMRRRLVEYFGTPELFSNYVDRTHAALGSLLREALALDRLAVRYPNSQALGENVRPVVQRIAGDHIEQLKIHWSEAHGLLAPVFAADPKATLPVAPHCAEWAGSARPLLEQLREVAAQFDGLAVDQDRDRPMEQSPELLQGRLRTALQSSDQEVSNLCIPK
jgi:hypothetical protein